MGYIVTRGSDVVFQPGNDARPIHSARLSMATSAVSKFEFTIPRPHPLFAAFSPAAIRDFANPVAVEFDGQHLFHGFVSHVADQIDGQRRVTCLSDVQLLADVHMRLPPKLPAQVLFSRCVAEYNRHMLELGKPGLMFVNSANIDSEDAGYYDAELGMHVAATTATSPTPILDILTNGIIEPYGCMLYVWMRDGRRHVGLYTGARYDNSQVIRFGENMTSFTLETSDEGFYTGCYPLGATRRDESAQARERGGTWLTIARDVSEGDETIRVRTDSGTLAAHRGDTLIAMTVGYVITADVTVTASGTDVPIAPATPHSYAAGGRAWYGGSELKYTDSTVTLRDLPDGDYGGTSFPAEGNAYHKCDELVYHRELARRYGLRTFTFSDSAIEDPTTLLRRAMTEIHGATSNLKTTLDVDAVDVALYMDGYVHLEAGHTVRVVNDSQGFDQVMQVTAADLDLDDPGATRYTLGVLPAAMSRRVRERKADTEALRDNFVYEMNNVVPESFIRGLS